MDRVAHTAQQRRAAVPKQGGDRPFGGARLVEHPTKRAAFLGQQRTCLLSAAGVNAFNPALE